ncbi:MAG: hypothetical protein UT61_C0012G0022 [Candidatus Woesebacteria bacterium GW2011_GWA1_39_8]|uniref:ATP-grasp domain-containing protein n=1 Tax=Candidatus Woesebacteria bacterium GW2011_GWA1_39_8 TaxID=1618552 RepID=A0A0G0SX49_9BACT|nr:MAG: hypothetical protein UT61_C0012G0022 [Candidatus Woesebacteria bacterium GW2011_GWA1_39_8]
MANEILVAHSSRRDFEGDGDPDNVYIPGRTLVLGINRPDVQIILPSMPGILAYENDLEKIVNNLNLNAPRTIYVPDEDYLLDVSVLVNIGLLQQVLVQGNKYSVEPYSNTPELQNWINVLREHGYDLNIALPEQVFFKDLKHPQHRAGWSRNVEKPDEQSFAERYGILYPCSYWGTGLMQLKEAYERVVDETNDPRVVLKPVFSAGGSTIRKVNSLEEAVVYYDGMVASGALFVQSEDGLRENPIEVQQYLKIKENYSFQYRGDRIATPGGITKQYTHGTAWKGNLFNSFDDKLVLDAADKFRSYRYGMTREYPKLVNDRGGADLAEVEGCDELALIEWNGSRFTGADPANDLSKIFGVTKKAFLMRMVEAKPNCGLGEVWEILQKNNSAFSMQTKSGVFPITWFEGCTSLFVAGENASVIERVYDTTIDILDKEQALILN